MPNKNNNQNNAKRTASTPLPDTNLRVTRKMSSTKNNNAGGDDVQYYPSFGQSITEMKKNNSILGIQN